MKNIKMVVFDMAGTTINEDNLVYKTLCKSITDKGFEVSLAQTLTHGAGKEKLQAIKDVLKACTDCKDIDSRAEEMFADFKIALDKAYDVYPITGFEGIEDLFRYLKQKGITVVLNTGYDSKTANKLLSILNWRVGSTVDGLITADDVTIGRPTAQMIQLAMSRFDITDSSEVLKAGDSIIDIQEGLNAHCGVVVGVLTGAQNKQQLQSAKPTYILDKLIDLKNYL